MVGLDLHQLQLRATPDISIIIAAHVKHLIEIKRNWDFGIFLLQTRQGGH